MVIKHLRMCWIIATIIIAHSNLSKSGFFTNFVLIWCALVYKLNTHVVNSAENVKKTLEHPLIPHCIEKTGSSPYVYSYMAEPGRNIPKTSPAQRTWMKQAIRSVTDKINNNFGDYNSLRHKQPHHFGRHANCLKKMDVKELKDWKCRRFRNLFIFRFGMLIKY